MTLHDVFNRVHPKPVDADQEVLFERFMHGDLDDYPDVEPLPLLNTWETVISERGNTRDAWETLLEDDEIPLADNEEILHARIFRPNLFDEVHAEAVGDRGTRAPRGRVA